jgi:hypothetical protein
MCGEREEAFLQASEPLIPVSAALGSHRALRQPEEGRPPHILDALLQGLAINRVSIQHFKIIVPVHFPFHEILLCVHMFDFFQENNSFRS